MSRQLSNLLVVLGAIGVPILGQVLADHFALSDYAQSILFKIALNISLTVGLSLIIGSAGQFSIGHAGFMSLGGFFSALVTSRVVLALAAKFDPAFLEGDAPSAVLVRSGLLAISMLAGMIAAGVASVVIGLPTLRLRGDYLAIATLGFGEIVYNLLLVHLQRTHYDTAFYMPYQIGFMSQTVNIASSWIIALLSILVVRNLVTSTSGRALPAIREDEIGSAAVGIRTTRFKLLAFVIGSIIAGAAGVLETHQTLTANPASYRFDRSIEMIVPVVLGGSQSLTGAVVAAGLFTYLLELLRGLPSDAQQFRTIVYASVLVLVMVFRPKGLMGHWELGDLARWVLRRPAHDAGDAHPNRPRAVAEMRKSEFGMRSSPSAIPHSAFRLACRDLTIRFGGLTAVSRFNLDLESGEIAGLVGPNGAGKTTCFNMITGVYRPTSGHILLHDRSLVGHGPAEINRRGIARTFQNIRLFSDLTVLDNVRIAMHAHLATGIPAAILRTPAFYQGEVQTHRMAMELLDVFTLAGKASARAGALPYGDQRRLEIARALATRPRLLCLDEPAAGMNPAEKRQLMDLIRHIRGHFGLAILLIEHDMKVVMGVCERILVLDHGETIAEGSPEEVRQNPKVIEAYLGKPIEIANVE